MIEACKAQIPPLVDWGENHFAACIRVREIEGGSSAPPLDVNFGGRAAN